MPLLAINDLKLEFRSNGSAVRAVDGVTLHVENGETVCLVGESGCGKSVTALSIARLLPMPPARYVAGEILLAGRDVLKMTAGELREVRGGVVSYVFQEPAASLNPVMRIGAQVKETLRLHRREAATDDEVLRLLKMVGISAPESRLREHPHQMSGGMLQRVMIAMALAAQPRLLVADEPTTALDVTIQAQIIELLRDLRARHGMSILLITHNLGIVGDIADRVAVMYAGQIVEVAAAREILTRPLHPYTRALIKALPRLGSEVPRLATIPGMVPNPANTPTGCRFHPRCAFARPDCATVEPPLGTAVAGRLTRCPFWEAIDQSP